MDAVRWGVLGVAGIAVRAVMPAIQRSQNGRLGAIASRTAGKAEEVARRMGVVRAHGSYEALLDDPDVQAVYIPLPNSLHREWTIRCAESGKHVLCEKPLALSPAECDEMAAACRQHRVVLMEAFMYRFHPRTEEIERLARGGALGEIRLVRAGLTSLVLNPQDRITFKPDLGGGALYDVGCYIVNVSRMVLGEPDAAFAYGRVGEYGVDEQAGAVLRFPKGQVALLDCSLRLPRRQEYEIVGADARVTVPHAFGPGTADTVFVLTKGAEQTVHTIPGADQFQRMVEHVSEAILSGAPVRLPAEDSTRNLRVITALRASLQTGRPQPVSN
jgi:predicted dehydrogenase